jgi:hypothetical protein
MLYRRRLRRTSCQWSPRLACTWGRSYWHPWSFFYFGGGGVGFMCIRPALPRTVPRLPSWKRGALPRHLADGTVRDTAGPRLWLRWNRKLTSCFQQEPVPEADSLPTRTDKEYSAFHGTQKPIAVFTKMRRWSISCATWIHPPSPPLQDIYLTSILIISSHLNVGLFNDISPSGILINICIEECSLLGCGAVWVYYKTTFRRNASPPSSGQKK